MSKTTDKKYNKFVLYLVGSFILVLGITLVLAWWEDVVTLFRGATGLILALAGLGIFYYLRK